MKNFSVSLDWNHQKPWNGRRVPSTETGWKRPKQGDFSSSWYELCSLLGWPWLDSEQDGEQCSSVAWFLMIQISKNSIPASPFWAHLRVNKLCYCWLPFLEVPLPQLLWSNSLVNLHFSVEDHNYHVHLSWPPWSIGDYFRVQFCLSLI